MNEIIKEQTIKNMIYEIRGKQVMLDSDLAKLYQCKNGTKEINQAVKNNPMKFPERFTFKLSDEEYQDLRSKLLTTSFNMSRATPRVFTEQGVAMLATILKTAVAAQVSIQIMDAFVAMRKYISTNLIEQKYINELVLKDNQRLNVLEETFSHFKENNNEIFFEGQIYDAYSKMIDIMNKAKKELVIIDAYADKKVLDMIANIKVKTTLICKTKTLLKELDIQKYNEQYNNLVIKFDDSFHD